MLENLGHRQLAEALLHICESGRIAGACETAELLTGLSHDQLTNRFVWDILPDFPGSRFADLWQQVRQCKTIQIFSILSRKPDSERQVRMQARLVRIGIEEFLLLSLQLSSPSKESRMLSFVHGIPAAAVFIADGNVGSIQDISDQQKTLKQELQRSENRFKALLEAMSDGVACYDTEFRYLFVNATAERVKGIPCNELLGKTDRELGLPPEMADKWEDYLRQVFVTGQTQSANFEFTGNFR